MSTAIDREISRLRAENSSARANLASLQRRLDTTDRKARRSSIESRVIQLEAEGFELDRVEEVERLSRMSTDQDVDNEISRMRKNYRQSTRRLSPVGQDMLPIGQGLGGNSLQRGLSFADLMTPPVEDTVQGDRNGSRIWGESIARMALQAEENGDELIKRPDKRSPGQRKVSALRMARAAVKRFQAERNEITRT